MHFRNTTLYSCGEEGGLVAGLVRVEANAGQGAITWVNPGGRQRAYDVARVIADDADHFAFEDHRGRTFELRELTPAFYNEHVRRSDQARLETAAALLAAFEESLR